MVYFGMDNPDLKFGFDISHQNLRDLDASLYLAEKNNIF